MGIREFLKRDIGTGERAKPITFQQVLSLILGFVIFIFGALAYSPKTDPGFKDVYRQIFWLSLLLFCLSIFWHFRVHSHRRNLYPDILGAILPSKRIFAAGDVHLSFQPFQEKNYLVLLVLVQNNFASATNFTFVAKFQPPIKDYKIPKLECSIQKSSVIMAQIYVPLSNGGDIINFQIKAHGKASDRTKTRFNRRQALDIMPMWLKVLAAIAGRPSLLLEGKWKFALRLYPFEKGEHLQSEMKWNIIELWTPFIRRTPQEIINLILGEEGV